MYSLSHMHTFMNIHIYESVNLLIPIHVNDFHISWFSYIVQKSWYGNYAQTPKVPNMLHLMEVSYTFCIIGTAPPPKQKFQIYIYML